MYLGYQENKIKFYTEEPLNPDIYNLDKVEETDQEYVLSGEEYVLKDSEWEEEQAQLREENFKSQFFEIQGYNWYRKQPKGYTSALESLNVAYNMITSGAIQELPSGTFIFYPQPDFTKPEQCTEEWLIANQILSEAMNAQQFIQFYAQFVVAWNTEMHENLNES